MLCLAPQSQTPFDLLASVSRYVRLSTVAIAGSAARLWYKTNHVDSDLAQIALWNLLSLPQVSKMLSTLCSRSYAGVMSHLMLKVSRKITLGFPVGSLSCMSVAAVTCIAYDIVIHLDLEVGTNYHTSTKLTSSYKIV